jgi:hypothetical protein
MRRRANSSSGTHHDSLELRADDDLLVGHRDVLLHERLLSLRLGLFLGDLDLGDGGAERDRAADGLRVRALNAEASLRRRHRGRGGREASAPARDGRRSDVSG